MIRKMKKLKCIVSSLAVLFLVTACSNGSNDKSRETKTEKTTASKSTPRKKETASKYTAENAKNYVTNFLGAMTTGDFTALEKETGRSQSVEKAIYKLGMDAESKSLMTAFPEFNMSLEEASDYLRVMLKAAKYEVTSAQKSDENFIVTVQVQSCTGIANESDVYEQFITLEAAEAAGVDIYDEAAFKVWAGKTMLNLIRDGSLELAYAPAEPLELTVLVSDQDFELKDGDLERVMSALFPE
jgi:hypothetical protein